MIADIVAIIGSLDIVWERLIDRRLVLSLASGRWQLLFRMSR